MLAVTDYEVAFLQWTRTGTALTGSITQVVIPDGSTEPTDEVLNFTGTYAGDSVSIILSGGKMIRGSSNLTGVWRDGDFTLSYPGADGSIATLTFHPATVGDYNQAEQAFRGAVASAAADASAFPSGAADNMCEMAVSGHAASVTATGPGALEWCRKTAGDYTFQDGSVFGAITNGDGDAGPAADIVCGGAADAVRVVVSDTGTKYGNEMCQRLPIVRAWLGVHYNPVGGGLRLETTTYTDGTIEYAVYAGGPADKAGLRAGDIVTALDGVTVATGQDVIDFMAYASVGDQIDVTYLRAGKERHVEATLARRPAGY